MGFSKFHYTHNSDPYEFTSSAHLMCDETDKVISLKSHGVGNFQSSDDVAEEGDWLKGVMHSATILSLT